jgi:hypothetical protein
MVGVLFHKFLFGSDSSHCDSPHDSEAKPVSGQALFRGLGLLRASESVRARTDLKKRGS